MSSVRLDRVRELLKEVVGEILLGLKDPRLGFVSVMEVEVSPDIHYAKVFVSILGNREEQEKTMEGLRSASGFVRHEISKRVRLRYIPEITFKFDDSLERGARILEVIGKVATRDAGAEPPADGQDEG